MDYLLEHWLFEMILGIALFFILFYVYDRYVQRNHQLLINYPIVIKHSQTVKNDDEVDTTFQTTFGENSVKHPFVAQTILSRSAMLLDAETANTWIYDPKCILMLKNISTRSCTHK